MEIFEDPKAMQTYAKKMKINGKTIGLVPTMGALHDGHFSLVRESIKTCDITIASIYVNPTQFGENEDLDKYPSTLEQDKEMLIKLGVDALFLPTNKVIYPDGYNTWIEVKGITNKLCGASRPVHFRGVTTIVSKLFNMCLPDYAFFGQKDFQQCMVIKRMVKDLNFPIKIVVCPIIREKDGLAMSSRNKYLSEKERKNALILKQTMDLAEELIAGGETSIKHVKQEMKKKIKTVKEAKIDYLEIINPENLESSDKLLKENVIALAVFIGKTRLIDNKIVKAPVAK